MSTSMTGPLNHGAKSSIGTTEVALSSSNTRFNCGVVIKAMVTNPGTVYVGAEGVLATTGYPLAPGDNVTIECVTAAQVKLIASNAGNEVRFIGV